VPNLSVRPVRADDFTFFRALAQDERVVHYVGDGTEWTDAYVEQRFADALDHGAPSHRDLRWYIAETPAAVPVGLLALTRHPGETEIGYWIAPDSWGNGYASQLVEHAVAVAIDNGWGPRLEATVHRDNLASRRVVERVGFVVDSSTESATSAELTYRLTLPDSGGQ
jgi:[ribosomal protein S5]-alanine N-acetyltransferase